MNIARRTLIARGLLLASGIIWIGFGIVRETSDPIAFCFIDIGTATLWVFYRLGEERA